MRAIRKIVTIAAAVAAVSTVGVGSALADPSSTPPLTAIVGVGSDTLTPVFHQLTADYNASHSTELASWDAVDPTTGAAGGTIITKASSSTDTTCSMVRPDGSSAGITALENTVSDAGHPCVDFARSSRAPQSTDPTTIAFARLAKDAITWSSPKGTSTTPSPAPKTLTVDQLANIYNCTSGFTTWSDVGGTSSAKIIPVLPQSGSGTRSTFLLAMGQALGLGPGVSLTPGPCVVNGTDSKGVVIEENTGVTTGNLAEFGTSSKPKVDAMFPYSIGDYVAQTGHKHSTSIWKPGDLGMKQIAGKAPTVGSGTSMHINTGFPVAMDRILYDVTDNAGTAAAPALPTSPENLLSVFGTSAQKGWICQSTGQADIVSYGFLKLGTGSTGCGSVTDSQLGP
jgi:ABC-type phosphate transport system substrate-binding protein